MSLTYFDVTKSKAAKIFLIVPTFFSNNEYLTSKFEGILSLIHFLTSFKLIKSRFIRTYYDRDFIHI